MGMPRRRTRALGLLLLAGGVLLVLGFVRLNVSPSLPYGLYRLHRVEASALRPGMLVIAHVPGWTPWLRPLLKPVAAVAGEWVCRAGQHLRIHGTDYGVVYDRWRGAPLPSAVAEDSCVMVPSGQIFLASPAPQSLDSRYVGPIDVASVRWIATPLWTW
jgi:type IV secretory pathway protease TraF